MAALATGSAATVAGCANDQETVNRVQPNALQKSLLEGDWYYLQTVIDTPAGTNYTFTGDQGNVKKIRWEIQEDYLIARRAYDRIAGSEKPGPDKINDAANPALAMYKISSHFDVRRDYNPATGEQTNVIEENTTDRPWNEREYMRVDWAENLITDGDFMMIQRVLDGIKTESSYYVQKGADAPRFEKDANGLVNYMDIVNKMFVSPTQVHIPGFGDIPTCLLTGSLEGCEPSEISVRNSFLKVEDRDYQPVLYTGDRMQRFGFFVDERTGYNDDYGFVESERFRFAQRHNLWQTSHKKNGEEYVSCTSDAQCDDKRGSTCDTAWGLAHRKYTKSGSPQGLCTIPFRDREIRPIVYYTSSNLPADLKADSESLASNWNKAFVATVSSLRENECLAHGGKDCASERTRKDHQKIFYVCNTPGAEGAPEACGEPGFEPRPGDLRYSQVVWVSSEESGGPLGYGPGKSDPETGETLMGNAFIYGAALDRYAVYGRDLVKVLNGDLTVSEVQGGDYINLLNKLAHDQKSDEAEGETHAIEMDEALLARNAKSMDYSWANSDVVKTPPRNAAELVQGIEAVRDHLYQSGAFGHGVDEGAARLARLKGSDLESMMVTPEMRMAAGLDPFDTTMSPEVLEAASPLRGRSLDTIRAVERGRQLLAEKVGYYDADFADEGLVGLAMQIKAAAQAGGAVQWYGKTYNVGKQGQIDYDAVANMIRHPMYNGVTLHEIGHSIGLRHNFSGSYDAVNYAPQYWDMRDDGKMEPRLWDPLTAKEKKGRIREYQYSTVMDYGNNFIVTDANGIGHYDMDAIKMGYGDMVEVFTAVPEANKVRVAGVAAIQQIGYPILLDITSEGQRHAVSYTQWPSLVGGRANLQKRVDVPYTDLKAEPTVSNLGLRDPLIDSKGRVAVPYMFCSDEQADLNPDCMRYDAGADPYESVQSIIDSYWYYYPFISFRRQRIGFDVGATVDRIHGRYFEKIKRAHQIYALYRPIFKDMFNIGDDDAFWTAKDGMGSWSAAATVGFKLLQRVVTAPEPGGYGLASQADGTPVYGPESQPLFTAFNVDPLDGRFLETTWDTDAGYYWFDQLDRVGYFYDKVFALLTLVDPTTYFVGRDTDADIRKYQLNYATTFGPGVNSLFRSLLSEDWTAVAPRVDAGRVTYPEIDQIEKRNMLGKPVLPNVSFSIQLYAAVFGMAYIPQTYDQTFVNSSRLWVMGGAEEIEGDPSVPLVTFVDPDSKITYAAMSYPTGEKGELESGVGASLLKYTNAMFTAAAGEDGVLDTEDDNVIFRDTARKFVDNVDIVRRLTWQLGFGAQP
jgi:hypothetical protein